MTFTSDINDCCAPCPECNNGTRLDLDEWCSRDEIVCWNCCPQVHRVVAA